MADEHCLTGCPYGLSSMSDGFVYTLAGDGTPGSRGDGGPATAAELREPTGVAFDGEGDLLVGDVSSDTVRLVAETSCAFDCQYGLRSTIPGDIYTVAGNGTRGFTGDDKPATSTDLDGPIALAVDGVGDLLIADTDNNLIRIVPDIGCSSACPYGLPALYKGFTFTAAGNNPPAISAETVDRPPALR